MRLHADVDNGALRLSPFITIGDSRLLTAAGQSRGVHYI